MNNCKFYNRNGSDILTIRVTQGRSVLMNAAGNHRPTVAEATRQAARKGYFKRLKS